MNELKTKYLENRLNHNDLKQLQELVNTSKNSEISDSMKEDWESFFCDDQLPSDAFDEVVSLIEPSKKSSRKTSILKWVAVAAAVLLIPILLTTSIYYYNENTNMQASDMTVATGNGERANITLPDGTKVAINSESSLTYSPYLYNKYERKINFTGEAFFDVAKNATVPFMINTSAMSVKVLGTSFNLRSRDTEPIVTVILEDGIVKLTAGKTRSDTTIYKNQQAVLDKSTGEITVSDINPNKIVSWRSPELRLNNVKLDKIIESLSEVYGVKVGMMDNISTRNDLFSGTITTRNLTEALRIIEKSYRLKIVFISDREILFTNP